MPKGFPKTSATSTPVTRSGPAGISHKKATRSSERETVMKELKKIKDGRAFNAEPSLTVDSTGVCRVNTGKMSDRSQREVYNYARLVNKYLKKQRGKKVKVKSTKGQREKQALFCGAVRTKNKDLFDELNQGKTQTDKMFSVVAHVPDECIQVRSFEANHNQSASTSTSGIAQAPGWMPMTRQANGLVARIGNQTPNSTGQPDGPYVSEIQVDGLLPSCLLPIQAVTDALGDDPYDDGSDDSSSDSSSDDSS